VIFDRSSISANELAIEYKYWGRCGMKRAANIDKILADWAYDPNTINVRLAKGSDGRQVIQMRIEMGVLQLEVDGRPDGTRPGGEATYFDYLIGQTFDKDEFVMSEEQCFEVDREFVQFYHRRVCWLALREFTKAVRDANHTLGLMDFCREHSPNENWTMTHEQYRPFVMFHQVQAAALDQLEHSGAERAVETISQGLDQLRRLFAEHGADEEFESNELAERLVELRESLREKFSVGRTLQEQLADAIASEQYELAAQLRDELAARTSPKA
jgi:hypothetical protein